MEYNKVAAKWWADKLRNAESISFVNEDNYTILNMLLATHFNTKPSNKSIDLFEERLAESIKEHVEAYGYMILAFDCKPDYILDSITKEVCISTNAFPHKTIMRIEATKISVMVGDNASKENIFIA